ncbi:MAG: penicillin-binding protein 2 [Anaerolineae bacterium]
MTDFQVRLRTFTFLAVIVLAFAVFSAQLWRLQVWEGERYQRLADRNRFRQVEVDAPRGIIYDREGRLLVRNRPTFDVVIIPAFLPEDDTARSKVFARLSELLKLPITTGGERETASHNGYFRSFLHHEYTRQPGRQVKTPRSRLLERAPQGLSDAVVAVQNTAPYRAVTVAEDVDPRVAAIIEEERLNLPGVLVEVGSDREYLTGALTSHLLGYVGPIPPGQTDRYEAAGYGPNDKVGLVGVEASYEQWLRGHKGQETIEVDVTGRKIGTLGQPVVAQLGHNLILTLDLDLQEFIQEELAEAIRTSSGRDGVTIAMDPRNGQILAMVSLPTFDNNLFAQGISAREYSLLAEDERRPLVNHAISGLYPPGSTFKIVPAAGALQEGAIRPDTIIVDQGVLWLPNKFHPDDPDLAQPFYCWNRDGHGRVDFVTSLSISCDVYYYQVGGGYEPTGFEGLGLDNMIRYAEMFGFGAPTGIDIPGEAAGLVPTPRWKRLNYAETWVTGDTYNMAIGQGFVLATPLQVLNSYAAIANGGTLYRPYLVEEVRNVQGELVQRREPQVLGQVNVDPDVLNWVRLGLQAAVDWGTAAEEINVPGVSVAGKTGTAEFCDRYPQCLDREGRVRTSHAWFVAYAPSENPEIAVITFVYGGGEGSKVAAPVVNNVLRYYFGIDRPEEETDEPLLAGADPRAASLDLRPRLVGVDTWDGGGAAVTGFVLTGEGTPVPDVAIEIVAQDQVVGQVFSGPTGQFDYNLLDPSLARTWQIRLPDYPGTEPLQLDIVKGARYLIEFAPRVM